MNVNKKMLGIITILAIGIILGALITWNYEVTLHLRGYINQTSGLNKQRTSIHATITIHQGDTLILKEYHAGAVTDIGDNMTIYWETGNDAYKIGASTYLMNTTYISIGNKVNGLSTSATVLPNEWNRTLGTVEVIGTSQWNLSCTFYPTGSQTADCIGINWDSGIGNDNELWAYDEFTEVTGIDNTFTINVEFSVTASHT